MKITKPFTKPLNVLITGGAGFIGTALYEQLKEKHSVKRIDIVNAPGCIQMDLAHMVDTQKEQLRRLVKNSDVVYHLASSIGVQNVEDNPAKTLENSTRINNNIMPYLINYSGKVIFASTSEVYGSSNHPFKESDDLKITSNDSSLRGGYAAQKILAEFRIKASCKNSTIVRFFNVVSKDQKTEGMVFPTFYNKAKNNEDITIYGDGSQVRSYCDIRDAVNVLELLLTEMDNEIINIGDYNIYNTLELAEKMIDTLQSASKIVFEEGRVGEIQSRVPDLTKMLTLYKPKHSLEYIIKG